MFESFESMVSWINFWILSGKAYEVGICIARGLSMVFIAIFITMLGVVRLFFSGHYMSRDGKLSS
jgi:hypothetical protein